ncbi:hypothetical protein AWZ03_013960 [Drosophila navojoa]|uniref:Proteasome subunit beta n=1 Tax=Drosophila navojoa TaxID=7232 RepID=A0A484ATB2_DRONA|nr:proteasome subunit beta type-1-like [Drosophila navojoa]TDG39618.1 hypothetical protein AWZ03_013960 [Drosophila navojoa]
MDAFFKSFNRSVFGDINSDSPEEQNPADLVLGRSRRENPYEQNGGTVMALTGPDFVLLAADTRLSCESHVLSRRQSKLFKMTPTAVVGSTGCWCDVLALTSMLRMHVQSYEMEHRQTISTEALAHLISVSMYNRRFFPYFTYTLLAGLDSKGKPTVYYYDPVGHYECVRYRAVGTSLAILQPCLDQFYGWENCRLSLPLKNDNLTMTEALDMARKCLRIGADRDTFTGDKGELLSITSQGMKYSTMDLRGD